MKKTVLCSIALAFALTLTAAQAPADDRPAVDPKTVEARVAELGIPMPPAKMSPASEQTLATLFQAASAFDADKQLTPQERVDFLSRTTHQGTFWEFSGLISEVEKMDTPQQWYELRDHLYSQAERNPGAYLALFATIRQGGDTVPAEMRTDEYMRGLVDKAAAGGDVTGHVAAAGNHTWGFYGTPVDQDAAAKHLLPLLLQKGLRRNTDVFPFVLDNVGMLCREGADKLPLRIAAFSLERGYLEKTVQPMTPRTIYAYSKAVLAWGDDEDHAFGGMVGMFVNGTILRDADKSPEAAGSPELYFISEECAKRAGDTYRAALLHAAGIEHGGDPERDYQVPLKPEYTGNTYGVIQPRYMSQEEQDYFAVALPAVKKYCEEKCKDSGFMGSIQPILDFVTSAIYHTDEGDFKAMEQLQLSREGVPGADYMLYLLYDKGMGDSCFGKDAEKAALHLEKACKAGYAKAIVTRARKALDANPEPTKEILRDLVEFTDKDAAYLLYRLAKAYPDEFTLDAVTGLQQYALAGDSVFAWQEMAARFSGEDTDLETRIFVYSLLMASGEALAEDALAFDKLLEEYGAAHAEHAGLVKLLRLSLLNLGMDATTGEGRGVQAYAVNYYHDVPAEQTATEIARRIEGLVKDDMSPADFAELHRRLQIDIEFEKE